MLTDFTEIKYWNFLMKPSPPCIFLKRDERYVSNCGQHQLPDT
jgi:hypothetical protein